MWFCCQPQEGERIGGEWRPSGGVERIAGTVKAITEGEHQADFSDRIATRSSLVCSCCAEPVVETPDPLAAQPVIQADETASITLSAGAERLLVKKQKSVREGSQASKGSKKKESTKAAAVAAPEPPDEYSELVSAASALLANGASDEAVELFTKAICVNSEKLSAWIGRSEARRQLGDTSRALQDLSEAVGLDPNALVARSSRADLRLQVGDFRGAEADYTKLLLQAPADHRALYGRGEARLMLGDKEGARADLEFAVQCGSADASKLLLSLAAELDS